MAFVCVDECIPYADWTEESLDVNVECDSSDTPVFGDTHDSSDTPDDDDDVVSFVVEVLLTFASLSAADVLESELENAIAQTTNEDFEIVSYTDGSLIVVVNFIFEQESAATTFYEGAETILADITVNGESPTGWTVTMETDYTDPVDDTEDYDSALAINVGVTALALGAASFPICPFSLTNHADRHGIHFVLHSFIDALCLQLY